MKENVAFKYRKNIFQSSEYFSVVWNKTFVITILLSIFIISAGYIYKETAETLLSVAFGLFSVFSLTLPTSIIYMMGLHRENKQFRQELKNKPTKELIAFVSKFKISLSNSDLFNALLKTKVCEFINFLIQKIKENLFKKITESEQDSFAYKFSKFIKEVDCNYLYIFTSQKDKILNISL